MSITKTKILLLVISFLYIPLVWATTKLSSFEPEAEHSALNHLQTLSSDEFAGRKFSSKASIQSQSYLISTLKKLAVEGFENKYSHRFKQAGFFQTKQGANIIGFIPGTHFHDQYILLSAHYDHLGTKRNKVYNGADDNASGTAALLYYAKLLKQNPLKHSVILLFSDGEEINLLGAKAFINDHKNQLGKFKLNINLDMIAGSIRTKKLRFMSKDLDEILSKQDLAKFDSFQRHLKSNNRANLTKGFRSGSNAGSSINRTNWLMASDHGVFSRAGIPFIYFGVGVHKNYHSEHDNYANINHDFYISAINIIFQQLTFLDNIMSDSPND